MVWAADNDPQEHDATPPACGHEGVMYHVRDDEGVESISCASCITGEMETELKQGVAVTWTIVRLTDDEPVVLTDHEFQPARLSGEDMCTYSWRVESERTYCQRAEREHVPMPVRCTYHFGGAAGQCLYNAEPGNHRCRRHRQG